MYSLECALEYHRRGWSIIPIGPKKKPALRTWKPYQSKKASEAQLREWFRKPNHNMGVVLGKVSGQSLPLCTRDFDDESSFDKWSSQYPQFATRIPTVMTARGYHLYFETTEIPRTLTFNDGEFRANGSYTVLPPSVHETGFVYEWTRPLPIIGQPLPIVGRESGLLQDWSLPSTSSSGCTEKTEITERTEITDDNRCGREREGFMGSLEDVISLSTPTGKHQNHKHLFTLARGVRALEGREGQKFSTDWLREVFNIWHEKAKDCLKEDQSKDEYWFEFLQGYERVLSPLGQDRMQTAWERAQINQVESMFEDPKLRILISFCNELQKIAGNSPFYLSCRVVQRLFKQQSHTTAALWLKGLANSKIIEITEKGGSDKNRATRYRYIYKSQTTNRNEKL